MGIAIVIISVEMLIICKCNDDGRFVNWSNKPTESRWLVYIKSIMGLYTVGSKQMWRWVLNVNNSYSILIHIIMGLIQWMTQLKTQSLSFVHAAFLPMQIYFLMLFVVHFITS